MTPFTIQKLHKAAAINRASQFLLAAAFAMFVAVASGCSSTAQSKAPAPAPPEVSVAEVVCKQLGDVDEFTGRLEAVNTVEVRPRVSGYLQKVFFKEGAIVRQGDILVEIDPRPFQAEVDRLKGELAQAKAELARAEITEGNLVQGGAGQITPLTTLVSLDPIYVYFDADEQTYLKYARVSRTAGTSSHDLTNAALLGLADEDGFPHVGRVNFVDNQVSSTTGTIRVRATFPNKNFALTPGLFARVRLEGGGAYGGCLAKDESVVTDLNQKYVFVLGKNNTLEYRTVKLGPLADGLRVVREGLHDGDVIVTNGLQRVRPGTAVTPKRVPMITSQVTPANGFPAQSATAARESKARN